MMKKFCVVLLLLGCLLALSGCGCDHVWLEATCQAPATCKECGETEGERADHSWKAATCEVPATCGICGQTQGEKLEHQWKRGICTATCENCGVEDTSMLGHLWSEATCEAPKICGVCGMEEGEPLPHQWQAADCSNPKRCTVCKTTEGAALGHTLPEGNDGVSGVCTACGKEVECFWERDTLCAWTEYEIESGKRTNPVTYIRKSWSSEEYIAEHWFRNGVLQNYENTNHYCKVYYADGAVYYFRGYTAENPEAVVRALSNAASRYVSFTQATYSNMNCLNPTLDGPGGWFTDTRGYVNAAVDAYGKPYAIVHKCPATWEDPDDPAQTWAVACDWMK